MRMSRPFCCILSGATALAALAGSAIAQTSKDKEPRLRGSLDQPLGVSRAGQWRPDTTTQTHVTISSSDESGSYSVKIHNDEISAEANGQPVPPDRIDRRGNTIIIKDENGNTLKTFDVAGGGVPGVFFTPRWGQIVAPETFTWQGSQDPFSIGQPAEPPPVMVGITMADADPTLLEHLDLEAGSAFMIDRVIEGLPAQEAGLKPFDLVTAIDGQEPATQEKFREALKDKKPGDTLDLTIIRKGKEQKVGLKLVAYDAGKFGQAGGEPGDPGTRWMIQGSPFGLNWSGSEGATAEARKRIEEALRSIRENPDLQPDKLRKRAEEALEQALKSIKESRENLAQQYYQLHAPGGRAGKDLIIGDRPGQFFTVPGQPAPAPPGASAPPDRDMARRMERLGEMLERLDKRLDEIEKRLEKSGR